MPHAREGQRTEMTAAPYPTSLIEEHVLADGTRLTVRPIRPEDAEIEQAFVRGLSPRSKHFRFMQAVKELSPQMLARFTEIDYDRHMALIALRHQDGAEWQVGVARYVGNPDARTCEFAIVVADAEQHRGIGSILMRALMAAARAGGFEVMEGQVLADNSAMLRLMRDLGFTLRRATDDRGVFLVERTL